MPHGHPSESDRRVSPSFLEAWVSDFYLTVLFSRGLKKTRKQKFLHFLLVDLICWMTSSLKSVLEKRRIVEETKEDEGGEEETKRCLESDDKKWPKKVVRLLQKMWRSRMSIIWVSRRAALKATGRGKRVCVSTRWETSWKGQSIEWELSQMRVDSNASSLRFLWQAYDKSYEMNCRFEFFFYYSSLPWIFYTAVFTTVAPWGFPGIHFSEREWQRCFALRRKENRKTRCYMRMWEDVQ